MAKDSKGLAEEHQRLSAKRQAFIEHYRTMKAQRRFARDNAARIEAEWNALPVPPITIAQHVEHARSLRNDILTEDGAPVQ